uniref:Curli production assembly/transport component CsgF n=1 Tax=Haemonchus contortus TaxID=6289 RepID=A0A7I4YI52_HAECO
MFPLKEVVLLFLMSTWAQAQYPNYNGYNNYDPFRPDFNPLPPDFFQTGVFSPGWGANLARQIERSIAEASSASGVGGVMMSTNNGVSTIQTTIGGRPYTATFAGGPISTSRNVYNNNGNVVDVFTIVVNGVPYIYTTVGGRTTVTDGQGNVLPDGGPFHVPQN